MSIQAAVDRTVIVAKVLVNGHLTLFSCLQVEKLGACEGTILS
jgi:hypothetical protein